MGVASEIFNSILSALHLLVHTENYYTNIIVPLCRDRVTVCCSTVGCEVILGRRQWIYRTSAETFRTYVTSHKVVLLHTNDSFTDFNSVNNCLINLSHNSLSEDAKFVIIALYFF